MKRHSVVLTAIISFLCVATALSPAAQVGEKGRGIAIVGGLLVDGRGNSPVEDYVVLVEGARIKAVGSRSQVTVPPNFEVINAAGKTVLPGLINSNCHL